MRFNFLDRNNLYHYAEDGGADNGGGSEDNGASSTETEGTEGTNKESNNNSQSTEKLPAYFSQFRKDSRAKYSSLSKYKSLEELADAALKGDNAKEPDYTGYVKMPTKESSKEEIKDFLTKLGVPESPDKYNIPKENTDDPLVASMEKTLREVAYRSGLTDGQTKSVWGMFRALIDTAKGEGEKYMKDRKDNFDERYSKLFDSYTQQAQKDAAIKESLGYFKTFVNETGIAKALESSGAIYDENLVKALADYQKKNRGQFNSGGGSSSKPKSNTMLSYSDEFKKAFNL